MKQKKSKHNHSDHGNFSAEAEYTHISIGRARAHRYRGYDVHRFSTSNGQAQAAFRTIFFPVLFLTFM